jgi:hypothetical protein
MTISKIFFTLIPLDYPGPTSGLQNGTPEIIRCLEKAGVARLFPPLKLYNASVRFARKITGGALTASHIAEDITK